MAKIKFPRRISLKFSSIILGLLFFVNILYADTDKLAHQHNAQYWSDLADDYDEKKHPKEALAAIQKAVDLEPNNLHYLQSLADLADENNKYELVKKTYFHILQLKPNDKEALHGLANAASSRNHLDESIPYYLAYLKKYPNDKAAWIEYIQVLNWRQDSLQAVNTLEQYAARFGKDDAYISEKARVYAGANWSNSALELINPLVTKHPKNFDYLYTKALAEKSGNSNMIPESLADLERARLIQPNSDDARDLNRYIISPLRNYVSISPIFSWGKDTINTYELPEEGRFALTRFTSVLINLEQEVLTAKAPGYLNINGRHSAYQDNFLAGLISQITPKIALTGQLGAGARSNNSAFFTYNFLGDFRVSDQTEITLRQARNIYNISPRSVSLGVMDDVTDLNVNMQPAIQHYVNLEAQFNVLSDNNNMTQLEFTPYRQVVITQEITVNLGGDVFWQNYARHLNDGYYAPPWYERILATSSTDFHPTDNVSYTLNVAVGTAGVATFQGQRGGWGPACDLGGSASYDASRDWKFVFGVDFYNESGIASNYNAFSTNLELLRRLKYL